MNLNIVCFDVPFPADYGGAMEEFYKLKGLCQLGVRIHLHCFVYDDRKPQKALEQYCEQVHYYVRKKRVVDLFSSVPFIVKTRMQEHLLQNLLSNDYPILFDATHSTGFLNHPGLKNRKKIIRLHNIEWIYYNTLFRSSVSAKERLFYFSEYKKLREYDRQLEHADALLCLSRTDYEYYLEKFPDARTELIYVFHENEKMECKTGRGKYILYHGNLSVLDNYSIMIDLLENQLKGIQYPVVLAGKNPDTALVDYVKNKSNIQLIANPSHEELDGLIQEAQICLAVATNPSGIKLKLINSMYRGRFIFSNESAFVGSGLEDAVVHMDGYSVSELHGLLDEYMQQDFTAAEIEKRSALLSAKYDNLKNAEKIVEVLASLR